MPFKNNQFSEEPDADHAIRIRQMWHGLVTYGDELGFTPEEVDEYETYSNLIDVALDAQQEEFADVSQTYVELKDAYDDALAKFRACQALVRAEIQFAEKGVADYLMERFYIDEDLPKTNKGFIKQLEYMVNAQAALGVEQPDIALPVEPFDALAIAVALYDTLLEKSGKELSEQIQATAVKDELRKNQGEKLLRKGYHRVVAYWGNDDPRMFELGLVPKSSIWTEGDPEPGEPELPVFPNPPLTFTLSLRVDGTIEVVWTGVTGATHMLLEKRKQGEIDWSLVMNGLPADPAEILPYIDPYISPAIWEYRMIPMNGDEHGMEIIAVIEVPEG